MHTQQLLVHAIWQSCTALVPRTTVQHTAAVSIAAYNASSQGFKGIGAGCISV